MVKVYSDHSSTVKEDDLPLLSAYFCSSIHLWKESWELGAAMGLPPLGVQASCMSNWERGLGSWCSTKMCPSPPQEDL